jgi:hypothetical protein
MPRLALLALLPALLLVAACGDGTEDLPTGDLTSADAVADAMLQRYNANVGEVETFTVTGAGARARYTVSGDTTGLDRFNPPEVTPAEEGVAPSVPAQLLLDQVPNVPRLARGLRTAAFRGPINRDGRRAYVFTTDDPGALFGEPGIPSNDTTSAIEFSVYVDADAFDVIEISQVVSSDSLQRPITSRTLYSNFQTTDGLTLAHTVQRIETGVNQMMDDTDRMLLGGNIGIEIERMKMEPASPERDAQIAELQAQQRIVAEGVSELTLEVTSVQVGAEE